ncbi:uncharacterized protein LOC111080266 [Drosophila obscura]|uniref:uncharacterized protein LOC111080266 n=1 Tax=Drosophila obscura TaxID=7282 RepID=UPI001BB2A0A0|nr:uncharacterized protein LOC111080266 [Drosophila obscura]
MADLPKERLDGSHAFEITGVDFFCPFFYKPEARKKAPIKFYVCVFICFAIKAVHLELIKDLSTVSFLHGLKRFTCTRRRPQQICDDHQKAVLEICLVEAIDWHFISTLPVLWRPVGSCSEDGQGSLLSSYRHLCAWI